MVEYITNYFYFYLNNFSKFMHRTTITGNCLVDIYKNIKNRDFFSEILP